MKNKILLGLLVGSLAMSSASADMYVGVEYGVASNTDKIESSSGGSAEQDNAYSDLKLKIGGGEDGGIKAQISLSMITYDKTIFDYTNKDLAELGVDIIKEFEVTKDIYPFLKVGLGYGSMTVEGYAEDSIAEVSFNFGAGVSYKAMEHVYLIAGIDFIGRTWQDIQAVYTYSTTGSATKPYVGLNYQF
ncbi:porin family protein [bacterium]|nr:porin family protein [bacterium]MBU1990744.1 porin family protein [bacterium]